MSEHILFVKEMHVANSNDEDDYQFSLVKEEVAWGPPILNTTILLSDGQEFHVERIVQDLRQDRFIVFYDIIVQYYERGKPKEILNKYLKKGWKKKGKASFYQKGG